MASISEAGIYGVGTGILHPKHRNRWNVIFVGLGRNTGNPIDLSMQTKSLNLPSVQFEEVKLDRYNSVAYVAGKHTFDPLNLSVEDDVTNRATTAIRTQFEAQQRLIGASGPWLNTEATASTYKFKLLINSLDGNETILETWVCQGCWFSANNWGEIDYADGTQRVMQLTIRYDHAYQLADINDLGTALGGI